MNRYCFLLQVRPELLDYIYDLFTDNCVTRVRDLLDEAGSGALRRHTAGPAQRTLRQEVQQTLAPVPLLALLKHPLVGGEGDERLTWLEAVRALDLKLRGPRPAAGIAGLDAHFGAKRRIEIGQGFVK